MALQASVIIYDCDDCNEIVCLKEDADWEKFEEDWHAGLIHQYCPKCRFKVSNQAAILADEEREKLFNNSFPFELKKVEVSNNANV